MVNPEIEYVYSLWNGKIERCRVTEYNPATGRLQGIQRDGRRFMSDLNCGLYFRTPQEAVREEHVQARESLKELRQEVQTAISEYRAVKRVAMLSFEAYYAEHLKVP